MGQAICPHELVFVGYPHGLLNTYPSLLGFVTGLVRRVAFSGVVDQDGRPLIILDGFNNPGYSGGSVYAESDGQLVISGLISGYRFESILHGGVYRRVDGVEEIVSDVYVKSNSGMIYMESFRYVRLTLERLRSRNPIL